MPDLFLSSHNNRKRRRLNTTDGRQEKASVLRVEGCERARPINAYKPIGLRSAACSHFKRLHILIGAQRLKSTANG